MNNKSKYNPQIHHRRSIRLKGYDYSRAGLYYITICVQDRVCLFGEIVGRKMVLNDPGKMIEKWYYELGNKFPDISCHEMFVMPNHFHCIIENVKSVGADLCVCPNDENGQTHMGQTNIGQTHMGQTNIGQTHMGQTNIGQTHMGQTNIGQTHRFAPTGSPLHRVMQWFKTMTTNEYIRGVKKSGWQPFNGKLWQRNYWEHIIRNDGSYHRIAKYIINNPAKWMDDKLNPVNPEIKTQLYDPGIF
jgi:REP element-mobilizing transposase RayT